MLVRKQIGKDLDVKRMEFLQNFKMIKSDNKGSVMVTVLVAFFFVSILAAIILSTVSVNIQMRSVDRKTKDEFYYAEKTLNDIYNGLGQELSDTMGKTYNATMAKYKGTDGYKNEEKAYKQFTADFVKSFQNNIAANQVAKFDGYIVNDSTKKSNASAGTARAIVRSYGTIKYYESTDRVVAVPAPGNDDEKASKIKSIVIEDVKVQSNLDAKENKGYVSELSTDIVIDVPKVSFLNTNNKVYDYALIANSGIEFQDGSRSFIRGNVYGGTIPSNDDGEYPGIKKSYEYGGIYIKDGAKLSIEDAPYIVSGGDIYVDNGTLNINQELNVLNNQVWFENIEVNGQSTILINGDLFAADDLQVNNGADNSTVTIKGNYYGYNDGGRQVVASDGSHTYKLTTKKALIDENDKKTVKLAPRSSSIIMNSKNADIDLENLKTLLLLGNAYINHESKADASVATTLRSSVYVPEGKNRDAAIPESVAIKSSQFITLVPSDFLSITNPCICSTVDEDPFADDKNSMISEMTTNNWFGREYVKADDPYFIVKVEHTIKDNAGEIGTNQIYAYAYLNFKDEDSKIAYVNKIVEGLTTGAEPTAATVKENLIKNFKLANSTIKLSDDTRVYSKNAILGFDGTDLVNTQNNAASDSFSAYSANLYKRYRLLDTYLDAKADMSFSAIDNKDLSYQDLKKEDNEMPLGRFFWLWGLRKGGSSQADKIMATDIAAEKDKFGSNFVFIRNVSSTPVDISSILSGMRNAFVIIDGNACVGSDLTLNGFIACTGKFTVNNNVKFTLTYDSTLLNKRIAKELQVVSESGGYHDENLPQNNTPVRELLIYYMMNSNRSLYTNTSDYKMKMASNNITNANMDTNQKSSSEVSYREYKYFDSVSSNTAMKINTDYMNFVYFENWKKGQQ